MTVLQFLVDECVNHDLVNHLRDTEPAISLLVVGAPGAPPKGTLDRVLLSVAEATGRVLISGDRTSMMRHLKNWFAAGRHTRGVILLRGGFSIPAYAAEIRLVWFATTPEEWIDRTDYIPY